MNTRETMPKNAAEALQALRDEIDGIDRRLLEVIRERIACGRRIGQHKKLHDVPISQPHRIGIVQRRAEDFAHLHRLNVGFVRALYDLVIEDQHRIEGEEMAKGA